MIGRIVALSIRHRVAVILITLAMAGWGARSAWVAPVDAIPDLSENQVIIHAEWPGHEPSEVEEQVTSRLALDLDGFRGVRAIRSSSDFGASTLWVILEDSTDVTATRRALSERLASPDGGDSLPPGVHARLGPDGPATGQIFWYTVEGGGLDLGRLRSIQDGYVKPRLAALAGVAEVASVGGMVPEVQVEADPTRLRLHRVALGDLIAAVAADGGTASGGVLLGANAEHAVRSANRPGDREGRIDREAILADLRRAIVPTLDGRTVLVEDVASVGYGPRSRRGAMEKDGVEVAGGVVLMARGGDPLDLTRRLKAKLVELADGLPPGVRLVPTYDRTPLILGAVETVSGTIVEAMISASICVLLVLKHARASLLVAMTLPLSVLACFGTLDLFRRLGIADIPINAMSLAGLAISIGVLVDSAIVMTENVLHALHLRFGDRPIAGDVSEIVEGACRQVGRPIAASILIILLSFLPVFALGGLEGRMFRPLAITKTLAMAASGILAITFVPALCATLVRGRARAETDSRIVRRAIEVYRPVLDHLLDRPSPLLWVLGTTFVFASAAIGLKWLFLATLGGGMLAVGLSARGRTGRIAGMVSLAMVALVVDSAVTPLGREFIAPLDEGTVMDMPISVPGMSIVPGVDDLKSRDMILCRFPEVAMVVGKLGRAETPTDPAPLDMIETMVEFHPREYWPARAIDARDARFLTGKVVSAMVSRGLIGLPDADTLGKIVEATTASFDAQMREYAYQSSRELFRSAGFDESRWRLEGLSPGARDGWKAHSRTLDSELLGRAPDLLTRLAIEQALTFESPRDPALLAYLAALKRLRARPAGGHHAGGGPGHAMSRTAAMPAGLTPQPTLDALQEELATEIGRGLILRRVRREDLVGSGGELDRAVPMPGWTNIWTMPIQNRVDMLSTGVNTTVGIRVLGRDLAQVAGVSARVAEAVKAVPGAVDVVADPIRGKPTIEVRADRDRAARLGVSIAEVDAVVSAAIGGAPAAIVADGLERRTVRVRYARSHRVDEESVRDLLVRSLPPGEPGPPRLVPLAEVADIRVINAPSTIKGEHGRPCAYVRLNVRGRDASQFVEEARRVVRERVALPEGCFIEWAGRFEHEARARRTLSFALPVVLILIFASLWATYRDASDAVLVMMAVPGVLAGGVACQWAFGARFSVTTWVGLIACFGMAMSTAVIMLVYLRDALDRAGGIERVDAEGLRRAVLDGATQRLRPKLLTEATVVLGLVPMLWAGGIGGDIIRPMAAPVLGGILVADEVIDLFLPILFYWARRARLNRRIPT